MHKLKSQPGSSPHLLKVGGRENRFHLLHNNVIFRATQSIHMDLLDMGLEKRLLFILPCAGFRHIPLPDTQIKLPVRQVFFGKVFFFWERLKCSEVGQEKIVGDVEPWCVIWVTPGTWVTFQYKDVFSPYSDSHCKGKMVSLPLYLYKWNWEFLAEKTVSICYRIYILIIQSYQLRRDCNSRQNSPDVLAWRLWYHGIYFTSGNILTGTSDRMISRSSSSSRVMSLWPLEAISCNRKARRKLVQCINPLCTENVQRHVDIYLNFTYFSTLMVFSPQTPGLNIYIVLMNTVCLSPCTLYLLLVALLFSSPCF